MNKLLRAGMCRYLKSASFWAVLAISLILGLVTGIISNSVQSLGSGIFMMGLLIVIAIHISLMLGTELSDGIVRNKLVTGHGRGEIFFSELILSFISSTLMFALYYGTLFIFHLRGFDRMGLGGIAAVVIGLWLMHLAFAAICTAICFFIPYKSTLAAILNIAMVIGMMVFALVLQFKFDESEYYRTHDYEINEMADEPDLKYIPPDSAEYAVLHAAYYLMPGGQLNDYQHALSDYWFRNQPKGKYLDDLQPAPLYSFGAIAIFTAAGYLYFRKKDLK